MPVRRTDAETFALGMWAGTADNELTGMIEGDIKVDLVTPLTALQSLIRTARDSADLTTLTRLRDEWERADKLLADTPVSQQK